MSLETKIMEQLKQAMRDKNDAALRTLRAIKAAILVEKTAAGAKDELTEDYLICRCLFTGGYG
jgi:uncharacterized protein YqeY